MSSQGHIDRLASPVFILKVSIFISQAGYLAGNDAKQTLFQK